MAKIAGTTQATVSRWEAGELEPDREQLRLIRDEALRLKKTWKDSYFFATPAVPSSDLREAV